MELPIIKNNPAFLQFLEEVETLCNTNNSIPSDSLLGRIVQTFPKFSKKSRDASIVCLLVGLNAIASHNYKEALKAFTNAIRLVPPSSKIAEYCYFGRSVALKNFNSFSESTLVQKSRTSVLPVTRVKQTHVLFRKLITRNFSGRLDLHKIREEGNSGREKNLSYGESTELKGVSSAITLAYNKEFGRHYIATQDIKPNDILMIQEPYAVHKIIDSLDNEENLSWFCENCLDKTISPIPCHSCALKLYCSYKCRSDDFENCHKYECEFVQLEIPLTSLTLFFLRWFLILTKNGEQFQDILKLKKTVENCKDKRVAGFKDGKLDGSSAEAVLSLIQHTDEQKFSVMLINSVGIIANMLKRNTDYYSTDEEDVYYLAKFLLVLSDTFLRNMLLLRDRKLTTFKGVGLYPVLSYVNIASAFNTVPVNNKHGVMKLIAIKNIKKGEQILVSYNIYDIMESH